jgi:antitoxin component YwqK of YwqJK toxin-antitoxin module
MKNTLLVLLSLIMIVFSSSAFAKKVEKLPVERDGLYYEPFSTNIANGQYEIYHKNGQMNTTMTFKDGLYDGPYERYYKNGQMSATMTFKDGLYDGPYERYYKNGQLRYRGTFKDGIKDGFS